MPNPLTPSLSVDCVVLDRMGRVLLIRRRNPPFKGRYALPGGFVERGETVEAACRRDLLEETGIEARRLKLVGVYSDPKRDPRGPTVSVAFLARIGRAEPRAGDDAVSAEWIAPGMKVPLAFDHAKILAYALRLGKPYTR